METKDLFGIEVSLGAICPVAKLHMWEIAEQVHDPEAKYVTGASIEYCRACGEKRVYKEYRHVVDNKVYTADHIRDSLQPGGRTAKLFEYVYGKPKENTQNPKR